MKPAVIRSGISRLVCAHLLPRRFQRLWEVYFSYCEAGFREPTIGDYQPLFAKPRHRAGMFAPASGGVS